MDRGIIAKIKGKLRTYYNKWVVHLTLTHLGNDGEPKDLDIPNDWPTLRHSLFTWLSKINDDLNGTLIPTLIPTPVTPRYLYKVTS